MQLATVLNLGAIRDAIQELYGPVLRQIGRPEFYKPYLEMMIRKTPSQGGIGCNTPKYTLAVFDMFRVFCKRNLNVS